MSLRPKQRRTRRRRQQDPPPAPPHPPTGHERELDAAWLRSSWAHATRSELEAIYGGPSPQSEVRRDIDGAEHPPSRSSAHELQESAKVERLAYSRRQAAEALGVSISTIDRHIVPSINTVKTPWGQRLILVAELERFLRDHQTPARSRRAHRPAGRPPTLPPNLVERIRLDHAAGRNLTHIARALTHEGIPTAHGGRRWWPSTIRAVLIRSTPPSTSQTPGR